MTREIEPKCSALICGSKIGEHCFCQQTIGGIVGIEHIARLFSFVSGQADEGQRRRIVTTWAEGGIDAVFAQGVQQQIAEKVG